MTPHYSFTDSEIKQALIDLTGDAFTEDIIKTLTGKNKAKRQVIMYGDQEGEPADILVSNTEHELTDVYIQEISNLL